jgi:hypothetical protein
MDLMKYPYMSPMRHEDSGDEDSLADAKTVVAKTSKDKNCFCCRKCTVKGHTQDDCTYKRIPLKKEMCMIGIPPEDGDDTVEFEDDMKVTQTDVGDVAPRMEVENEAVSPWSVRSPEAKRLKIQEEMRQEEFNEKTDKYFDDKGLMLDMNKVKLNGIKPRMAYQEKTGSRGQPWRCETCP